MLQLMRFILITIPGRSCFLDNSSLYPFSSEEKGDEQIQTLEPLSWKAYLVLSNKSPLYSPFDKGEAGSSPCSGLQIRPVEKMGRQSAKSHRTFFPPCQRGNTR